MRYSDDELSEILRTLDSFVQGSDLAAVHTLAGVVLSLADTSSDPAERDLLLGMADVIQYALAEHHKIRTKSTLRVITGGLPTDSK